MNLWLRNVFFVLLQPGIVVGLIPYFIVTRSQAKSLATLHTTHYLGLLAMLVGLIVVLSCVFGFIKHGKGTLSPADPTQRLVIKGLYRYSRNPMYVGVLLLLLGEALLFGSAMLLLYMLLVGIGFHLFVVYVEEPRLRKDFGEQYKVYCQKVRRWV